MRDWFNISLLGILHLKSSVLGKLSVRHLIWELIRLLERLLCQESSYWLVHIIQGSYYMLVSSYIGSVASSGNRGRPVNVPLLDCFQALQNSNVLKENQALYTLFMYILKQMTLNYKDTMMIKQDHLSIHLFRKLVKLELDLFHDESSYLPFDLLRRFQNIKKLSICNNGHYDELFPYGLLGDDHIVGIIAQMQWLSLNGVSILRIWNQESQCKQVLQNLETLQVLCCHRLISLVPSFASFKNLQTLEVQKCQGLMNLLESSATNSLVHLRTMIVIDCDMATEIVATEADEIKTEITLIKLEILKLHCLKTLVCFSFANCPMKFPSLTEVFVTQCPKMKFFSRGNLYTPKLKKVYVTEESDKGRWVGDLNSTIKQLYMEMTGFSGMQHLKLFEFPELKEKWLAQLPVEVFYKLASLVVDDCAFQSVAIPSNLLPFLIALETLEIRNCDLLQELFDLEWPNADRSYGYLSNLKEFRLIDLPQLRHVSDEIPKDMLDVKNLTLLKIHNCSSLRNILTPTMCLGLVQLKNLQVTSCQMVEAIISAPASKERTIAPTIVFPLLECVIFQDLPNLISFYSRMGSAECPCLTEFSIAGCPQLNITNAIAEMKVFGFPHLKDLNPSSIDIQKIWNCQSLTSLMIDGFRNLIFLFSSSIAKSLVHLKKLEISNCGMLEQVIAMEGQEKQMMRLLTLDFLKFKDLPKLAQFSTCDMLECPSLKELQIENCPQLMTFVSNSTSNTQLQITTSALFDGKVAFPNLEKIQVIKMDNLRMIWGNQLYSDSFCKLEALKVEYGKQIIEIFPHNILARLQNLTDLVIKNCDSLKEVFDIEGLINAKQMERVTSQLKRLDIRNVLNLRCVWNEDPKGVVLFDELSSINVWNCPNLKSLFPFSIAKSLQHLKVLLLDNCGAVELVRKGKGIVEEAPDFVFPRLKELDLWRLEKLKCFFRGTHTLECPVLNRLSVYDCHKLDVFSEDPQRQRLLFSFSKIISNLKCVSLTSKDAVMIKESQFPPQIFHKLKVVELHGFDKKSEASASDLLKLFHNMEKLSVRSSMFKELFSREGGLDKALQTLKSLTISTCGNLIILAPFGSPFQNLTNLDVSNCKRLVSLMGHSTARSLVHLQIMRIANCDKVSEIVSDQGSDVESKKEIVFTTLWSLELNGLPKLVCFSSAKCSFSFPSMGHVTVSKCPNIKFFSQQVSTTPKLKEVQFLEAWKGKWNGDLNVAVKQLYRHQYATRDSNWTTAKKIVTENLAIILMLVVYIVFRVFFPNHFKSSNDFLRSFLYL